MDMIKNMSMIKKIGENIKKMKMKKAEKTQILMKMDLLL